MTLVKEQSYRNGSYIVEVHMTEVDGKQMFTRAPTDYGSINKAKKANRLTQYRVRK